uniref:Histidinol-phosphatase n=1 Tax=Saccharothrix mutabilis subsp. capreolus TaxID=66854 RepID=Q8RJW8_STRMP|nr:AtaP3 protein [Saccharothrix mutabilis subsp. capreolus]
MTGPAPDPTLTAPPPDLALALELADLSDAVTRSRFRARDLRVDRKPDRTPVTDADLAVEQAVRTAWRARPRDRIAGEEGGGAITDRRTWVVDPIDGTKNFLRGVPVWATSLALVEDGRPTVGVVSAPALRRRWWAAAGHGAWAREDRGTARLHVSGVDRLEAAYLSTTSLSTWDLFHSRAAYLRLADACWEDRGFGDFLQHCLVAEGLIDIAAEPVVSPWDVAAVQVIVEEAGGRCTGLRGENVLGAGGGALSANPHLHGQAVALLNP